MFTTRVILYSCFGGIYYVFENWLYFIHKGDQPQVCAQRHSSQVGDVVQDVSGHSLSASSEYITIAKSGQ